MQAHKSTMYAGTAAACHTPIDPCHVPVASGHVPVILVSWPRESHITHVPRCHPSPYPHILPAFCTCLTPHLSLASQLRFTLPPSSIFAHAVCVVNLKPPSTSHVLSNAPPRHPSQPPLCTSTTHQCIAPCHGNLSLPVPFMSHAIRPGQAFIYSTPSPGRYWTRRSWTGQLWTG